MSWRSIELQVALPRTQEVGKYQDQLSKQNQRFQESLAQSQMRLQELEKNRTNRFEKTEQQTIKDEDYLNKESKEQTKQGKNNTSKEKENEPHVSHPYLGHQVDITR